MQFPELNYPVPINIIKLKNNISLAYIDEGTNDTVLVFIHGLASNLIAWSKNIPFLKNYFRCIAFDLPGYGKSEGIVHSGTPDFYSEVISLFANELRLKKIVLVGHSMGGQIAINTALNFPSLIEKLILVAPAGSESFTDEEIKWIKENVTVDSFLAANDEQIRISYKNNFFRMPEEVEPMIQERISMKSWKNFKSYCQVVINSLYGLIDHPVYDKLHLINIPTLILFGKEDKLIPHPILHKNITTIDVANSALERNPNFIVKFFDECGHFLQFEKPQEFNSEVINFV